MLSLLVYIGNALEALGALAEFTDAIVPHEGAVSEVRQILTFGGEIFTVTMVTVTVTTVRNNRLKQWFLTIADLFYVSRMLDFRSHLR